MQDESIDEVAASLLRDAEAVLLDFNGTLSLDEDLLESCYDDALVACGLQPLRPGEYAELLGRSEQDIARALTAARDGAASPQALLDEVARVYVASCRAQPRVPAEHRQLLRDLHDRGIPLAIVTGTLRAMIRPVLEDLHLDRIVPVVVTVEDVARGKPDPEGFLLALERLQVDGSRLVVLEDSPAGIAAGHAAGARVIGCGDTAVGADVQLSGLGRLADRISPHRSERPPEAARSDTSPS